MNTILIKCESWHVHGQKKTTQKQIVDRYENQN